MKMGISTHVLDTTRGRPAAGVRVSLSLLSEAGMSELAAGETDADGRLRTLIPDSEVPRQGTYCIRFEVAAYFTSIGVDAFYPVIEINFLVREATQHYHVPLLLSPYGYSTYRGS